MSKPKKPGTDLAALKARLAKKTSGAEPAADVPPPGQVAAPAPNVPPPGHVAEVPAPGQVMAPAHDVPPPGHVAEVPAPGQVMHAHDVPPPGHIAADVPPPGQVSAPYQAVPQQQAPAPTQTDDNPFGGSAMGFDPSDGLIDGGAEITARGSKGLVLFAAIIAAGIGMVGGWIGHKIISTQDKIDSGQAKGEKMVAQVEKISESRKSVSLAMEDLKKEIAQEPAAAADKVTELLTKNFNKTPQLSEMFGWQLAAVDPNGIKATFQLYEEVNALQANLSLLAKILGSYGSIMKVAGPSLYGVTFGPSGGQMVAINKHLCGSAPPPAEGAEGGEEAAAPPAEGEAPQLKPCDPGDVAKAVAYEVNDLGGEPKIMARGVGENQVMVLLPEGKVYQYAIGIEPGNNAKEFYKMVITRVDESLAEMDKAEEKAMAALKRYAEDPDVDGSAAEGE